MIKKSNLALNFFAAVFFVTAFAGCPDRSMLREYPDLSKQSDSDSEEAINDDPDQADTSAEASK